MRAIRNFIYNFSDIFVAIIIIALAAFLIWTRIEIIMDYPSSHSDKAVAQVTAAADTEAADKNESTSQETPVSQAETTPSESEAPAVEYIEVTIPSGSSTEVVAGILKQSNIITNTNDFTWQVKQMGVDGQILAGTHKIPKGSSMSDMIKVLCQRPE